MPRISIFDWNGSLLQDVKEDEKEFGIKLKHLPNEGVMGHEVFEISGGQPNIERFLDHYELELEEVETPPKTP